jgi:rhodanese-related sulfurtransferase
VRSPDEYTEDHIGESQLVPLDDIKAGFGIKEIRTIIKTKPQNPTQPTLVLYCGSGQRSVKAYKQLENTGLNFVVLKGGIKAWRKVVPRSKDAEVLAPIMLLR